MRLLPLIAGLLLAESAVAAPGPRATSAYTNLDLDHCTQLDHGETPAFAEWRCRGYGGIPLFVQSGDDRYDVDAGAEDEDSIWANTFDYPGKAVEWRLSRGKPFAIIYRLLPANPEGSRVSVLVVETIGTRARPGCRIAMIPGSAKDGNVRARAAADQILRLRPPCLKPD